MGTKSTPTATDRRDTYLEAAMRLFATHGFDGTTMDMIVADVGGSKATLYRHFPSKSALVAGLMEQVAQMVSDRHDDHPEADQRPIEDVLTEFGTAVLKAVLDPRALEVLRFSLGEYHRFPELCEVVWRSGPAVTYAHFRRLLELRRARGEIQVEDTQLAAEHFVAGLVGHIQLKVAMGIAPPPNPAELRRRVAASVATFLARYSTPQISS